MKVRVVPAARAEFLEALTYFEEQRAGLGRNLATEISDAVRKIVANPSSCPRHLAGTRRCRLRRFKYGIVYRVTETEIRIIAMMHLHRRPGYWKGRG